jgi:hypothetical protein
MSGSGCVIPGIFSDFHFDIQVGDTRCRSESIAAHGLQRFGISFNRTAVIQSTTLINRLSERMKSALFRGKLIIDKRNKFCTVSMCTKKESHHAESRS